MIIFVTLYDEMNEKYIIIFGIARCWMENSFTVGTLYWTFKFSLAAQPCQSRWIVSNVYY